MDTTDIMVDLITMDITRNTIITITMGIITRIDAFSCLGDFGDREEATEEAAVDYWS